MKNQSSTALTISIGSLLCFLLLLHPSKIRAQETEDEREFDYAQGGEKGPGRWGELKKEWAACKNGEMQSPVDMSNQRVEIIRGPEKLKRNYKPCNATIKNRGHDITVQWAGDAGSIQINGTEYDMELHMVHLNTDLNLKNKIAVIAVLYKIGRPNPFLSKLARNITSMIDKKGEQTIAGVIDPREIKMSGKRFYRYMGSLTVPPCTEGVIWTISKKVRTVSRDQLHLLREAVHDYAERNARPLQPLHQRDIQLYGPEDTTN
ncbi:hypothetical protein RJ639_032152 [Escallonia herrerae]|uniref:Alpha-carbonic anhydrase domain-containing protein n=1 Tax=Escallonia herrerae TaxID=1293975 RepID=A0AA88X3R3_9ASTE|nr:hypothetical protein RJ639_032152 [Escallonia herrerae]